MPQVQHEGARGTDTRKRLKLIRTELEVSSFSVAGVIIPDANPACSKGEDFNQFSDKGFNDRN